VTCGGLLYSQDTSVSSKHSGRHYIEDILLKMGWRPNTITWLIIPRIN